MSDLTLYEALVPPIPPPTRPRYGIIEVETWFLEPYGARIRNCDTQGQLEDAGVFAAIHAALLLPASFRIRTMLLSMHRPVWQLCVESEELPPVARWEYPPTITLFYTVDCPHGKRTVRLKEMRIENRWQRTYQPGDITVERAFVEGHVL